MWREHAKAKAHVYVIYVHFWEISNVFPKVANEPPSAKFAPLAQTSSYATAYNQFKTANISQHHIYHQQTKICTRRLFSAQFFFDLHRMI